MIKAAVRQPARAAASANASASGETPPRPSPKRQKLAAFLVTEDIELWPQVGAHLPNKLNFRQLDSIGDLIGSAPAGSPAVVVWDARQSADKDAELSRLQAHSARFAVIVLDEAQTPWSAALERGQLVGFLPLPVDQGRLIGALGSAHDEANARTALLGGEPAGSGAPGSKGLSTFMVLMVQSVLGLAIGAAVIFSGHGGDVPGSPASSARIDGAFATTEWTAGGAPAPQPLLPEASEEKVDALIAQAQRAMRDRHFIEPSEGSALALYRSALVLDPSNGEAQQGLQRLSKILFARVQTALQERQFNVALQALETTRSIDPGDKRLPALDELIGKMRVEIGPAEIQAAINAQNFDHAAQLIELAVRSRTVGEAKLNQLREDLRRHRADSDASRLITLVDARMQQDELIDPPGDSAAYYLMQARKAGATDLQAQIRELSRRLSVAAHTAVGQQRFADADRIASAMREAGVPQSQVAALQRDVALARTQRAADAPPVQPPAPQSRLVDLVQSRLAEGNVTDPDDDSAMHYLQELKAADPQNGSIAQLSKQVQEQIVSQARTAMNQSQPGRAASLVELALSLGPSPEADALRDRLRAPAASAPAGPELVAEASLTRTRALSIDYPSEALKQHEEGSVEVAYTVTPKGTVSGLKVVAATPPGVFERAATTAVGRLKYKPVVRGGKPVAVSTKVLVIFRLDK